MANVKTEHYTGSDCTGSSGGSNRVLTLSNTGITQDDGFLVHASGLALALTSEYTVSHLSASTTVTFLNALWDDTPLVISYHQSGVAGTGTITGNDFEDGPLNDFGITVTRTPVTMTTDNYSGQKTYSDGSTNTISVVMINPKRSYALDKSGLTEVADAIMYTKESETINKYDKVLWNSQYYRVNNVSIRKFDGNNMFKRCVLFFIT